MNDSSSGCKCAHCIDNKCSQCSHCKKAPTNQTRARASCTNACKIKSLVIGTKTQDRMEKLGENLVFTVFQERGIYFFKSINHVLPVRGTSKNKFARNENKKSDGWILHLQNETRKNFEIVFATKIFHFLMERIKTNGKIDTATTNLVHSCVSDY